MMKKCKLNFKRILKWSLIGVFTYWILTTLIFGHTKFDSRKGVIIYGWSGLDALFTNEEFGFSKNKVLNIKLEGIDGPYIFDDVIYAVNSENILNEERFDRNEPIIINVRNSDKDSFILRLKKSYEQERYDYELPSKLIAISDIEGNFDALLGFLINNKVINNNYNWTFGNGHLVFNGDFFDRGNNVTEVLWLIYMLEEKAITQGGKVHFINGNHEIMNLYGDVSYTNQRYIEVAKKISHEQDWDKATRFLYSEKADLGKWLRTKNVIEKIGAYIFVHGGLNKKLTNENLSIGELNEISKKYYGVFPENGATDLKEKLVLGSYYSPYWDRGLSMNFLYKTMFFFSSPFDSPPNKPTQSELDEILDFYGSEKIVIGHTVVNNVSSDYNSKVIKIDVKHGQIKNSTKTQGFLIENGIEYVVDGLGAKVKL